MKQKYQIAQAIRRHPSAQAGVDCLRVWLRTCPDCNTGLKELRERALACQRLWRHARQYRFPAAERVWRTQAMVFTQVYHQLTWSVPAVVRERLDFSSEVRTLGLAHMQASIRHLGQIRDLPDFCREKVHLAIRTIAAAEGYLAALPGGSGGLPPGSANLRCNLLPEEPRTGGPGGCDAGPSVPREQSQSRSHSYGQTDDRERGRQPRGKQ